MSSQSSRAFRRFSHLFFLFLTILFLFFPARVFQEMVDCILATVDGRVITLTDIRVREAFGPLFEGGRRPERTGRRGILEDAIDEQVVLNAARERIQVDEEGLDRILASFRQSLGSQEFLRRMSLFAMNETDLKTYLKESLLYQKIISGRFTQSVAVSLNEIEEYYQRVYLPDCRQKGIEPQPVTQILDDIEARIKTEKMRVQISSWVANLRAQAQILVRQECLEQLEGGEGK